MDKDKKIENLKESRDGYKCLAKRRREYAGNLSVSLAKKNKKIRELERLVHNLKFQLSSGKVEVTIEKTEEGFYFPFCKKYSGVLTEGETKAKAKKNFEDAFISYLMSMLKHNEFFEYKDKEPK